MNWDAIGAVGEVVGAFAVVLTLIFLAREVRLSRLANEAASVDALATGWNSNPLSRAKVWGSRKLGVVEELDTWR